MCNDCTYFRDFLDVLDGLQAQLDLTKRGHVTRARGRGAQR